MSWYNGEIENAVGWGDISHASGYGGPPYIMGDMVDPTQNPYAIINPLARYKPIRVNEWGILNDTQRANARFGFGTTAPILPVPTGSSAPYDAPKNNWEYLRPRGLAHNEPYRALDFLSAPGSTTGYNAHMGSPIGVVWSGALQYSEPFGMVMLFNTNASQVQQGKSWNATEGITVGELLNRTTDPTIIADLASYNISLLLFDRADRSWNLITYNATIGSVMNTSGYQMMLYPTAGTEPGEPHHIAVPFLDDSSHDQHDIVFVVCLGGNSVSSGELYSVLDSRYDSWPTVYSLGFADNCDRFTMKYGLAHSMMSLGGMISSTGTYPLSLVATGATSSGLTCYKLVGNGGSIANPGSLYGLFDTPPEWPRDPNDPGSAGHTQINLTVTMTNQMGVFGTSSVPGTTGQISFSTTATFAASLSSSPVALVDLSSMSEYVWIATSASPSAKTIKIDLLASTTDTGESKQLNGATIYATS